MIVEYVIVLAVITFILIFCFPMVRDIMEKISLNVLEGTENVPAEPKTAVKEVATDGEFIGFLQILGISLGSLLLAVLTFLFINTVLSKKTANETNEEKSEEPTIAEAVEENKPEAKEIEQPVPSKNTIEFDKLPQNLFALVQDIQNNTELLLAHYEIKKDTYNIHELKRIQENELVELTRTYLNLSEKQQTRQESFLHKALIRLQKQVNRHKTKLEKEGQIEFSHAVRLVEKRYEE